MLQVGRAQRHWVSSSFVSCAGGEGRLDLLANFTDGGAAAEGAAGTTYHREVVFRDVQLKNFGLLGRQRVPHIHSVKGAVLAGDSDSRHACFNLVVMVQ